MRSGFSMRMLGRILAITCLLVVLPVMQAGAVLLTGEELYFDPESADFDFYPRVLLPDLVIENSHMWGAEGDPIVDADILPVLKPGPYPIGYAFDQSDYEQTPNVDYFADLTDGNLTATFLASAQYLVRIHRDSGASEIHTVLAETGLLEKPGSEDPTGPSEKISGPEGDLILVAEGDSTLDKAAENITDEGKTVERVDSVQDAINKIRTASQAAGEKIHVELVGHGAPGEVSMNNQHWEDENAIGPDGDDIRAFQDSIDAYVDDISIFSCRAAEGAEGDTLLQILANSIGHASGWTVTITVEDGYFNVKLRAEPESTTSTSIEETPTEGSWGWIKKLFR